jgi:regulator of sigma E protease
MEPRGGPVKIRRSEEALLTLFYYTVPFLAVLTVVVFFHELGHFLVGRLCGAKVDAFSLGFGPELCHFTDRWGTRWRIAIFPLGGYVKFHGDANAASVPDEQAVADMDPRERAGTLAGLSVWRRAAIVAAGPAANFVLAVVILAALFHINGKPIVHPQIQEIMRGGAAAGSELKVGDIVLAVDGHEIDAVEQIPRIIQDSAGGPVAVTVRRDGSERTILVDPTRQIYHTWLGDERSASLGIRIAASKANIELRQYSIWQAFRAGVREVQSIVVTTGHTMKQLIVGRESARQLSGPIGIAQVSGEVAQAGIVPLIYLVAILSVSIGLLNLMPIPLLDGGFLMFFAYEAVRGKALPARAQLVGFRVGLTFVAVLSVFVAVNDISKILFPPTPDQGTQQPSEHPGKAK